MFIRSSSAIRPASVRRTSRLALLLSLAPLSFAAWTNAQAATTYYVRTDGGSSSQCTGQSNTPYPGTGTAQACAWKHPFFALPPGGSPRIAGGDTLIIGSGSYQIGPGVSGVSCSGTSCFLPPIPSGPTTSSRTRILGQTGAVLWGTGGISKVFNLEGSSNVEVGNLEITDRNDCVYNHSNSSANCVSGGTWARTGLSARGSSNVWLHDLNIHGLAGTGVLAGGLSNWTVERVKINANGRVGWDGDLGTSAPSSNSGAIVLREVEVAWNGCGQRWQTGAIWACWAQQSGGYGDGLGTATTGGQWLVEDSYIHHNTSDGLDLRYMDGADGTRVTVRRLYAVGNAGNQAKVRGNSVIENSVLVSNCGYFNGRDYMLSGDNCRAGGNALQLVLTGNDVATVRQNTIAGESGVLIGATEGASSDRIAIQNNVLVGYPTFLNPSVLASLYYANNAPAAVSYAGNLVWNVKGGVCPSGSVCGQNPKLTNMALDSFDAEPLFGSPVIDRVPVLSGVTTDFLLQPRPSGSAADIGAYEIQVGTSTTPVSPTPTCTVAAPSLALAGPTTAVAAGTTNSYTMSVRNNDTSGCANTTFQLARSVPSGWASTLSATSMTLAPGASGTVTIIVTSPATATAGSYGIGAATSSSASSSHTAQASTTYSVAQPATTAVALTESIGTDKTAYLRGETAYMSARVLKNGVPVGGASVSFNVTLPNGSVVVLTATTGSDGYARSSLKISKGKSAVGTYRLLSKANLGTANASASTSFSVR